LIEHERHEGHENGPRIDRVGQTARQILFVSFVSFVFNQPGGLAVGVFVFRAPAVRSAAGGW
jgi:hypothetical protein